MKKRVPLHGKPQGYVDVDPNATEGAVVGLNLRWSDGSVVTEEELARAVEQAEAAAVVNPATPPAGAGYTDAQADARVAAGIAEHVAAEDPHEQYATTEEVAAAIAALTTSDIPEGSNLYHTDERAQDATGAAIAAGTGDGVTLTYDDAGNKIDATNTDKGSVAVAGHVALADPHSQYLRPNLAGLADGYVPKWDAATSRWIVAAESGGGSDPSVSITASEALGAGDIVNIWNDGGTAKVRKADATVQGKEAHGFVLAAVASAASAAVYFSGKNTALSGLTPGATLYLSTTGGAVTATAPAAVGNVWQVVGEAYSAVGMLFQKQTPITLT